MNARLHARASGARRSRSSQVAGDPRLERRVKDLERLVCEQGQLIRELSARGELSRRLEELSPPSKGSARAGRGTPPAGTGHGKSRLPEGEYRRMVEEIRRVVGERLPAGARVLVVSKGDDELLRLGGRPARHFPQRDDGVYLGHYPADGDAAVAHLNSLRRRGAQYLLIPNTSQWWLDYYAELREHLESQGRRLWDGPQCVIYKLRPAPRDPQTTNGNPPWNVMPSPAPQGAGVRSRTIIPSEVTSPAPIRQRRATAAVIVCVHNAPEDVRNCLASLARHRAARPSLILIDDGSDAPTARLLKRFAKSHRATLIRNDAARGYTFAANQGLRRALAGRRGHDYAVLLNSDTIVTRGWLDRLVACAESSPRIAAVGPLSNTASWQSVPELSRDGDWAANPLPDGTTVEQMAEWVAARSGRLYPRVGFLNGFCLAFKRQALEELGYFDEETFGRGYGEENDFCVRARRAGWELAVADDAYVYHAQSRSYSHDRRHKLSKLADDALIAKHGRGIVDEGVAQSRDNRVLHGIRARCRVLVEREEMVRAGRARWAGRRVTFLLPSKGPNGGCNVVLQEAAAMRAMGVDARILNCASNREEFERNYADNTSVPVEYVDGEGKVPDAIAGIDAAVATINNSVAWMEPGRGRGGRGPVRAYYVQDFEPHFYLPGSEAYRTALDSYQLFDNLVRVTKTRWNRDIVRERTGAQCHVIGPSVDVDVYRQRPRPGLGAGRPGSDRSVVRVAAMVRPSTPRRSPKLTMEILRQLHRSCGGGVEIVIFGCTADEPEFSALPQDFAWTCAGVLNRPQTAWLLNEVDVFLDFSAFQAMGLTALEAMACGAAVALPREGGAGDYARSEENCLVVDSGSADQCLAAARRLVEDRGLRERLARQGVDDVCRFYPERAAFNLLAALFPRGNEMKSRSGGRAGPMRRRGRNAGLPLARGRAR